MRAHIEVIGNCPFYPRRYAPNASQGQILELSRCVLQQLKCQDWQVPVDQAPRYTLNEFSPIFGPRSNNTTQTSPSSPHPQLRTPDDPTNTVSHRHHGRSRRCSPSGTSRDGRHHRRYLPLLASRVLAKTNTANSAPAYSQMRLPFTIDKSVCGAWKPKLGQLAKEVHHTDLRFNYRKI